MRPRRLTFVLVLLASGPAWASPPPNGAATHVDIAPVPVSPGTSGRVALVEQRCPTFSWGGVAGASAYELLVVPAAAAEIEDDGEVEEALRVVVPGSAGSFTPTLGSCLERGRGYAWLVRAVGADGSQGEWSEARALEVARGPSAAEVDAALEVLRAYREEQQVPAAAGEQGQRGLRSAGGGPETPARAGRADSTAEGAERGAPGAAPRRVPRTDEGLAGVADRVASAAAPNWGGAASLRTSGNIELGPGRAIVQDNALLLWGDSSNIAAGRGAMAFNTTGNGNTAVGQRALEYNEVGHWNTAVGKYALIDTLGNSNSGVGERALQHNDTGFENAALGRLALYHNTSGKWNTAVGHEALYDNSTQYNNTAVGFRALFNSTAHFNSALGAEALLSNTTGHRNTAMGEDALRSNTSGYYNTGAGENALYANISGQGNTAMGHRALDSATGSYNIAIGQDAGQAVTSGSNNILIGNDGAAETGKIRIGVQGTQSGTFVAGISGVGVTGVGVLVSATGQLGVATSSRRFKTDIQPLDGESVALARLRPVSFRYRPDVMEGRDDGDTTVEYGLIAEEVAEVMPDLVAYGDDGRPYTVRYHLLTPLLLAELQRQDAVIRELRARLERMETTERRPRRRRAGG